MKFVELKEMDKLNCTMDWVMQRARHWPKSIGRLAHSALESDGRVFLTISPDGALNVVRSRPKGTEMVLGYKRMDWVVDNVKEVTRETVTVNGKTYFADELANALDGLEVK